MSSGKVTPISAVRPPADEAQTGNVKVTRDDWLTVAMDVLLGDGVEQVKVLTLGDRLSVSRSSFYWYFKSRQHLLDALLDQWEATNTAALVGQATVPASTITEAVCNVFRCFVDDDLFNTRLDFGVREWARRSGSVRKRLDRSDEARLDALTAMFARHGYDLRDAETRARVLYYMQIGYTFAELNEPLDVRLARVPDYLLAFTGQRPKPGEVEALAAYSRAVMEKTT